jgi:hypothetical protein
VTTQTHSTSLPSARSSSGEQIQPDAETNRLEDRTARQTDVDEITAFPAQRLSRAQTTPLAFLMRKLSRLMFNLFPLAVVAAFFWLQVQIDTQNTGLPHMLVTIMTVVVELGLIFVWSLFI